MHWSHCYTLMSNAVHVGSNFLEHLYLETLIANREEKHLIEYLVKTILYEYA